MKRLAALAVAALILGAPGVADAAPSRVYCEQVAKAAANASGARPGSVTWRIVQAAAYQDCMRGAPAGRYFRVAPTWWWIS